MPPRSARPGNEPHRGRGVRYEADRRVAEIASRQHGIATLAQLRGAGLSERQVECRVLAGRLHRVHRGVYAVGHPPLTPESLFNAAVLAAGPAAALQPNARTAGQEFDFTWAEQKVILEIDPAGTHGTPTTDAIDREKQDAAEREGFAVIRAVP
jgi:hypothetical protein